MLKQSLYANEQVVGADNDHPRVYNVEFPNGSVKKYDENLIAENLLSQVDPDGFYTNVVLHILDHRRDDTLVLMSDKYTKTRKRQKKLCQTTTGW